MKLRNRGKWCKAKMKVSKKFPNIFLCMIKKLGHLDHPLQSYCDFLIGSYLWPTLYNSIQYTVPIILMILCTGFDSILNKKNDMKIKFYGSKICTNQRTNPQNRYVFEKIGDKNILVKS